MTDRWHYRMAPAASAWFDKRTLPEIASRATRTRCARMKHCEAQFAHLGRQARARGCSSLLDN